MAIEAGNVVWNITADTKPLNDALGDSEKMVKSSMGNILKVGQQVGYAFTAVGAGIVAGLGVAVSEAASAQEAQAQLAAVLKSTGEAAGLTQEQLNGMAAALQKTTTYGDEAIISAESLLLTFTNIGKDVFPQALETILDMSTALGQDLKSSSIQLGKALNDPIQGVTALRRVGVSFNEQQLEQIKIMQESGDLMGAQKLILAELSKEFGGSAAAAAGTFSGQLTQLKNQFSDVLEQIGTALIPVLQQLAQTFVPILEKIATWIQNNPQLTATITLVVAAIGAVMTVLGPLLIVLPGIVTAFAAIGPVVAGVGAVLAGVAAGPVLIVIAALGALVAAGVYVYKHWEEFVEGAEILWEGFTTAISAIWEGIKDAFEVGLYIVTTPLRQFVDGVQAGWEILQIAAGFLVDTFNAAWDAIVGGFEWVGDQLAGLWDWIAGLMQSGVDGIVAAVNYLSNLFGLGNVFGNPDAQAIPGRAVGGPVEGGMPYIVGEQGQELFVPESDGRIVPSSLTKSALASGGPVNITINGYNRDPRSLAEEISRTLHQQQIAWGMS